MAGDLAGYIAEVTALSRALRDSELLKVDERVGKRAQAAEADAAAASGGFPNWNAPFTTGQKLIDNGVSVFPKSKGVGPWQVDTFGRHAGKSAPAFGPQIPKKTKTGKFSKALQHGRKWNGQTRPRGTWDKGTAVIEQQSSAWISEERDAILRSTMGV